VSLLSEPMYEPLSYTWGEPDNFGFKIWVNGVLFPVRQNLLCALRVLRTYTDREFWIDAICINQADDAERGYQVELMRQIYKAPVTVLAWLGTPDETEVDNIDLDISPHPPRNTPVLAFELLEAATSHLASGLLDQRGNKWVERFLYNPSLNDNWKQLEGLCNIEYWKRVWIIQEVFLARNLQLMYGTRTAKWKDFEELRESIDVALRRLREAGFEPLSPQDAGDYRAHIVERMHDNRAFNLSRHTKDHGGRWFLEEVLDLSKLHFCRDKKDKVYGVVGLASDINEGDIPVEYGQSLFHLYGSVMRWKLRSLPKRFHSHMPPFSSSVQSTLVGDQPDEQDIKDMALGRRCHQPIPEDQITVFGQYRGRVISISSDYPCVEYQGLPSTTRKQLEGCACLTATKQRIWKRNRELFPFFSPEESKETLNGLAEFTTEEGHVRYAPIGIQNGDQLWYTGDPIYHSSHPRIPTIVRSLKGRHQVLGRAIVLGEDLAPDSVVSVQLKARRGWQPLLPENTIEMDLRHLQVLTCPLVDFKDESDS